MPQSKRNKIGKNSLCPCGSGKKFKRCHGNFYQEVRYPSADVIASKIEKHKIQEIQRKLQQGLGRPIVTANLEENRIVAVGNQIYQGKWKTFHDFLCDYIKSVMGVEWGNAELKKPYEDRHPLLKIYNKVCEYQKKFVILPGEVNSAPFTGAAYIYTWLSYNLYLIVHNAELQARLINRLKHNDQFEGAYYETYVAAIFIKAGFSLEFEDEGDRKVSHCEFIATHIKSGKKYSVECKYRNREELISQKTSRALKLGIKRPLHRALKKIARYERIV